MTSPAEILARPLPLPSGVTLPNRLVKAAMSEVLADESGAPSERLVRLYERWGRGGASALITGHVIVHRSGLGEPGNVVVEDERHLPALRRWAEAAQSHGTQLWMQINHAGRQAPRRVTPRPVAPSAVGLRGFGGLFAPPRALEDGEIRALVRAFARTAAVAQAAGFAGVEVHAAHGYLLSQFLSPRTNERTDEWGGDPARRRRFLLEVVRAIRGAVGPRFPIAVKLNSADFQRGGFTFEEATEVVRALDAEGIDLLEVTGGNYESPAMAGSGELPAEARASTREREAYFLDYARQLRSVTRVPLLLTGGMRTAETMAGAIAGGAIDAVGMARPLAFDPDLPRRLLGGANGATPVRLHTGVRKLDDMLQVFWYQAQLHRMADGLEPDVRLSKARALLHSVSTTFLPKLGPRAPEVPIHAAASPSA